MTTRDSMVAMHCDRPLVWTFTFSYAEWYCLECGGQFGMFGVVSVPATVELLALREANNAWFEAIAVHIITPRSRMADCDLCTRSDHDTHVTFAQVAAHERAMAALLARQTVTA